MTDSIHNEVRRFHEGRDVPCARPTLGPWESYISFPPTWPPFFNALFAANKTRSKMDAIVRTPPTIAQVLEARVVSTLIGSCGFHLRGEEVCERLSRLRVYYQNGGDVVIEEDPRNASRAVRDLEAQFIILLITLSKVTPELSCAVLVGVDDPSAERPELSGDDLDEVLEHVVVLRGLKSND